MVSIIRYTEIFIYTVKLTSYSVHSVYLIFNYFKMKLLLIKISKGGNYLIYDNFVYVKQKSITNGICWI